MSRLISIAYGCEIARDPAQNSRNDEDMLARMKAEIDADGWPGVSIDAFFVHQGRATLQISHGDETLSLDLLRRFREANGPAPRAEPAQPRLL